MKQADVVNLIFHHRETRDSNVKSESLIFIAGITRGNKNMLVYHSTRYNLNPAGIFADRAALSFAYQAFKINFKTGLGEREKAGAHPGIDIFPEKSFQKFVYYRVIIRSRYIFSRHHSVHLVKSMFVRDIRRFISEDPPRHHYSEWRFVFFHISYLNGAHMRSQ